MWLQQLLLSFHFAVSSTRVLQKISRVLTTKHFNSVNDFDAFAWAYVPPCECARMPSYLLVHLMVCEGGSTSAQCESQMNGMGMGLPPNPMMNQQGMHPHMMGQQPQAPGAPGMMPLQNGNQAVGTSPQTSTDSIDFFPSCDKSCMSELCVPNTVHSKQYLVSASM